MFKTLMRRLGTRTVVPFEVVFSDGSAWRNQDREPIVTLRFSSPRSEWRVLAFGHVGLIEGYFEGETEVEGDLANAFRLGLQSGFDRKPAPLVWLRNHWHELTRNNASFARAKANARFHYGLGTDFYRQWLDHELMMYTCGYWKEGTRTVEEAQRNKVEHVCRKLQLGAGDSVVDIGCGFGGFMFHAASVHGALVCGTNTTTEQVEWLRAEIDSRDLSHCLSVREADFREVHAQFDKVVSIGVLEHAGRDQLRAVVEAHAQFLKPGGLGMLHFIGHVGARNTEFYIRKHVFPGGWIPSLSETLDTMEACGLEVVDVENLRRHYALTLDAWQARFDANWERIHALDPQRFDERFRRIWRIYLISCAEMFRSQYARTHLFQIVFSKGNVSQDSYPMSRASLYEQDQPRLIESESSADRAGTETPV